jgi:hypothetical protein
MLCPILIRIGIRRQFFVKLPNVKFHEGASGGTSAVTCDRPTEGPHRGVSYLLFANPLRKVLKQHAAYATTFHTTCPEKHLSAKYFREVRIKQPGIEENILYQVG